MNALAIPTGEAAIVFFAERLGALRPLDDTETRALQRAIFRETGAFRRWVKQDDVRLLKMHKAGIRSPQIAETLSRTPEAVRRRLCDLRKAGKVKSRG